MQRLSFRLVCLQEDGWKRRGKGSGVEGRGQEIQRKEKGEKEEMRGMRKV